MGVARAVALGIYLKGFLLGFRIPSGRLKDFRRGEHRRFPQGFRIPDTHSQMAIFAIRDWVSKTLAHKAFLLGF